MFLKRVAIDIQHTTETPKLNTFSTLFLSQRKFLSYSLDQKIDVLSQLLQKQKIIKAAALVNDGLFAEDTHVLQTVAGLFERDIKSGLYLLAGLLQKKELTPFGDEERYPLFALKHLLQYLLYSQYTQHKDFSILSEKMLTIYDRYDLNINKKHYTELLRIYFTDTLNTLKIVINPNYSATPATAENLKALDAEHERFHQALSMRAPHIYLPKRNEELTLDETGDHIQYMLRQAIRNNNEATKTTQKIIETVSRPLPNTNKYTPTSWVMLKYCIAEKIYLIYIDSKKNIFCLALSQE